MTDVPENAPVTCPGTQSESAGRSSACQGCPNQNVCSSGQAKLPLSQREPEVIEAIKKRLNRVHHKIVILSGKGGVGKSSVTVCLARALCRRVNAHTSSDDAENLYNVGVLDLDMCGPSIPCMFGCLNEKVHQSQSGWSPVFVAENLSLMSVGFLLPTPDDALVWHGPKKNALIRQLLTDVAWTDDDYHLDFLLIDTPPGTSDEHLSTIQYLQAANCLDGALIVTTPQEIALSDVRKEIDFCCKLSVPVLGVVQNMTELVCSNCGYSNSVFPPSTKAMDNIDRSNDFGSALPPLLKNIDLLCCLPLDTRLTRLLDEGLCPFEAAECNDSSTVPESTGGLKRNDSVVVEFKRFVDSLLLKVSC